MSHLVFYPCGALVSVETDVSRIAGQNLLTALAVSHSQENRCLLSSILTNFNKKYTYQHIRLHMAETKK